HSISVDPYTITNTFNSFERNVRSLPYDLVIIDTPPAFGFEMFCGLSACDLMISPILYFKWVVQGFIELKLKYEAQREQFGKPAPFITVPSGIRLTELKKIEELELPNLADNFIPNYAKIRELENSSKGLRLQSEEAVFFDLLANELLMKFAPELLDLESLVETQ
ncbi:hypothetical protein CH368_20940, partial [Leptospira levettii]